MRLINVHTRQLEEYEGSNVPRYAILSHRWEKEEVTYRDFNTTRVRHMKGYNKIDKCCELAVSAKLDYVWVDTCCIDKGSSAELSEAINSMYRWYECAEVCYAYLSDVYGLDLYNLDQYSLWFSRGWTLQELIAPKQLNFYNASWGMLGTKASLLKDLSDCTSIPVEALKSFQPQDWSVAQKMSWASKRQTTRVEDRAYSLFGLFDIHMPLLYGEGGNSFLRLQEEIVRQFKDDSIFAWANHAWPSFGLFAASPTSFANASSTLHHGSRLKNIHPTIPSTSDSGLSWLSSETMAGGFTITNIGCAMDGLMIPWFKNIYIAVLIECFRSVSYTGQYGRAAKRVGIGIFIQRYSGSNQFSRIVLDGQWCIDLTPEQLTKTFRSEVRSIVIGRQPIHKVFTTGMTYGFHMSDINRQTAKLLVFNVAGLTVDATSTISTTLYSRAGQPITKGHLELCKGEAGVAGVIQLRWKGSISLLMFLGFDFDFRPFCLLSSGKDLIPAPSLRHVVVNNPYTADCSAASNIDVMYVVKRLIEDQDVASTHASQHTRLMRCLDDGKQHIFELGMASYKQKVEFRALDDYHYRVEIHKGLYPSQAPLLIAYNLFSGAKYLDWQSHS